MIIPTIVIAIAIVLVFLFVKKQKPTKLESKPNRRINPYKAVAVCCDESACDRAKALIGKRFLVSDTPLLPLLDCTSQKCNCTYIHHPDRRDFEEDRRLFSTLKASVFSDGDNKERRGKHDRRVGD
ncbi:MAG: hypothetical protein ACJA09_003686 [Alcanivorax sp.]|jgi:hypothetical protein